MMSDPLNWNRELLFRILLLQNGVFRPSPSDNSHDLLSKYLRNQGGPLVYHPVDNLREVLRKVVINEGGSVGPTDNIRELCYRWYSALTGVDVKALPLDNINALLRLIKKDLGPSEVGILDDFPGAIHAASFNDLLYSSYNNGFLFQLRRDSDNAVKAFRLRDIREVTPITDWVGLGNQGFVEIVFDQTGSGRHWTQTTTGSQPRLVNSDGTLNLLGGRAAGLFDGVDDHMTGTAFAGVAEQLRANGGFTMVIASATTSTSAGAPPNFGNSRGVETRNVGSVGIRQGANGNHNWRHETTGTTEVTTAALTGGVAGGLNACAYTVLASQTRGVLNGQSVQVTNFSPFDFTNNTPWRLMVGTDASGNADLGRINGGSVVASLLFNRPLSDAELQDITGLLSTPA